MNQLSIIFAGSTKTVEQFDGRKITVAVRALPLRFLIRVLQCAEFPHQLVELCCYRDKNDVDEQSLPAPAFPDIPAPDGLVPVPMGFCDNLTDAAVTELYEAAKQLNFQRAADHGKALIAAKKLTAPFREQAMAEVVPLVESIMQPLMRKLDALSNSPASAPSSSAAPEKKS